MFSSPQSSFGGRFLAPTICFFTLLTACADETVEQSSEAFSAMADVHTDPAVIQGTVEIDKLLIEQDPDGNWGWEDPRK